MLSFTRSSSALAAAACLLMAASAQAAPFTVSGSAGVVQVGELVTFTISDTQAEDGYAAVLDAYLADFSLTYDASVLQYQHADSLIASGLLTAPTAADPDPAGAFGAQFLASGPTAGAQALFSVTFKALQKTSAAGTVLGLSLPVDGAYGDQGLTFASAQGSVVVTNVPEPETMGLALAGALVSLALARRRQAAR